VMHVLVVMRCGHVFSVRTLTQGHIGIG
jgi:hypothetical protein